MARRGERMSPAMQDAVAAKFRALGEPSRLALLQLLLDGERSVGELVEASGLSQANVSKHLATLTGAGFLLRRKAGTTVLYAVGDTVVGELCDLMCRRVAAQARESAKAIEGPGRKG